MYQLIKKDIILQKKNLVIYLFKMVPVGRTLEKEGFTYRYFFIYLNFRI